MDADSEATCVLTSHWGGRGFPVDPVTIGLRLGIKVMEAELPEAVSGAIFKDAGTDPIIIIEQTDSRNRKRFSCAHEIGHYIWRSGNDSDSYQYVDLRSVSSTLGTDPEEIFANQFGASLLMPDPEVRKQRAKTRSKSALARHFGVSLEAIRFRLTNLRLQLA